MQLPPWSVIVSWPKPNYEDPTTRGNALLILMILFSVLVFLAVVGRYYSRIVIKRWFGWDDSMITLAWIFTIAMNAVVVLANRKYGWDRHLWDIEYDMIQNAGIIAFTAKSLFVGAATFTRLSLILFYYRLVGDSGIAWFRWVLHASMAFNVAIDIAFTCLGIWLCVPVQAYWTFPPMADAKCLDEGTATLAVGIINCVADLLTTLLPIPLVMRLQMPLKERIGVCILLSLGVVVTVAGVVRTYYIWQSLINSWDQTWLSYPLWICAAVEIDVAVICACAPALKPLLHKPLARIGSRISSKLSSLRSSSHHSRTSPNNSNQTAQSASRRSAFKFRFAKRSGGESIWDGEEEYCMLRLVEKDNGTTTTTSQLAALDLQAQNHGRFISASSLPDASGRRPDGPLRMSSHLGIVKSQSVNQEVSYLTTRGTNDSLRSGFEDARCD